MSHLGRVITFSVERYLRRHVVWCANLTRFLSIAHHCRAFCRQGELTNASEAKIAYADIVLPIDKNVVRLKVAMDDAVHMNVGQAVYNLLKKSATLQ